ncbi:hypothetical protein BMF94_0286 [Rhodotorula taiwanensis]|uniref:F-box domain-containing protein n=1 Tax=Rhodotorula taiwanensis TaxID=741276 RepID=A0A2S5BIV6_9BASI|nr:hypothetical protein BMF94_0286 [Rhodotorula taiwanensis]
MEGCGGTELIGRRRRRRPETPSPLPAACETKSKRATAVLHVCGALDIVLVATRHRAELLRLAFSSDSIGRSLLLERQASHPARRPPLDKTLLRVGTAPSERLAFVPVLAPATAVDASMLRQPTSLLSLPNELLLAIVAELNTPDLLQLALTCRRLLVPVRVKLYRRISLDTTDACRKLAAALDDNKGLRDLVKGMGLEPLREVCGNVAYDEDGDPYLLDSDDEEMIEDVIAPEDGLASWLGLQTRLPAVERVTMLELSPVAVCSFLEQALKYMPRLSCVLLPAEPMSGDDDAVACDFRRIVSSLPTSRGLELMTNGPWCLLKLVDHDNAPPLVNVRSLSLGPAIPDPERMAELASVFPNLQELTIYLVEADADEGYEHLLKTAPAGISTLRFAGEPGKPIDHLLHRFSDLLELRLVTKSFSPKSLLSYLRDSNLVALEFDSGAPVNDRFLLSLVDRPVPDFQAFKDEARPKWPTGCSEAGLSRVVEGARSVRGTAVDALDWDRQFEEELERALVNHAHPRPAHDFLEEVLGGDGASEALHRLRPGLLTFIRSREEAGSSG